MDREKLEKEIREDFKRWVREEENKYGVGIMLKMEVSIFDMKLADIKEIDKIFEKNGEEHFTKDC